MERLRAKTEKGMAVLWVTQLADELARADRVIQVGELGRTLPVAPPPHLRVASNPLVRLRVAPLTSSEGPRVATSSGLEIPVGSQGVTAILGPNGAGKSVLLSAAAGLGAPQQVAMEWSYPPRPPPIAALQFPELQIFEEQAADELAFAAVSRGLTRERALAQGRIFLEDLGLSPDSLMARRTWSLATGEKRLLEIVAALIAPSCLCVLDEPTAGLDASRREALGDLVLRVARDRAVLVATQDRDWVQSIEAQVFEVG